MSDEEPKVTECWTEVGNAESGPDPDLSFSYKDSDRCIPAILMWKEDYDAMVKRLEYRDAEILDLKVSLTMANQERWSWKMETKSRGEEIESLRKELEELREKVREVKKKKHTEGRER
jgi:tetrahydromethanopterin S-methyltransferase subunit G